MGLDPRRASGNAQGRAAQSMAELEARVARLENSTSGGIIASGINLQTGNNLGLSNTGAAVAVPGATISTNLQVPTRIAVTASGTATNIEFTTSRLRLFLDGVEQTGAAGSSAPVGSVPVVGAWRLALSAGSHTIALYASRGAGSGSSTLLNNSAIIYFQTRA